MLTGFSTLTHVCMHDLILPSGVIDTPMFRQIPEEAAKQLLQETPLGRLGKPEGFESLQICALCYMYCMCISMGVTRNFSGQGHNCQ